MFSLRHLRILLAPVFALAACGGQLLEEGGGGGPESIAPDAGTVGVARDAGLFGDASSPVDASPDRDASTIDGGTDSGSCSDRVHFAASVVDHQFGPGQNFNQTTGFPQVLFGPPVAGQASSVVSLGNGGWVVLAFGGNAIVDGPGPDFTVFENPLLQFKELATVAVSDDGVTWTSFPCTWQPGEADYGSCAGVHQVLSSPTNGVDPTDPTVSGGDTFDLRDIGVAHARFVRITDRVDLVGTDGVFDLDAVAIVNAECP